MRRPFVCGNWKMNQDIATVNAFFGAVAAGSCPGNVDLGIAPVSIHLTSAIAARGDLPVQIGSQDCHFESSGAHTGDLSATMVRDAGGSFAIVGHSERRANHDESSALVAQKAAAAIASGLTAIVCVGESLAEREAGRTMEVVGEQLDGSLVGLDLSAVVVAYEPVWAIGTGVVATPDQAQDVHRMIRERITTAHGETAAAALRILYGGSVKPDNAAELLSCPDIDGALVGGASLKPESFLAIAGAA